MVGNVLIIGVGVVKGACALSSTCALASASIQPWALWLGQTGHTKPPYGMTCKNRFRPRRIGIAYP
jgi:hypothetical protein